jgi:hypothetical protein
MVAEHRSQTDLRAMFMFIFILSVTALFVLSEVFALEEEDWPLVLLIVLGAPFALMLVCRYSGSWLRKRRREQEWLEKEVRNANPLYEYEDRDR